jgi:rhamnulokinase
MTLSKKILAFDLGAESGRGLVGSFDGRKLQLEVVHRFPNGPVRTLDTMHWDVLRLYDEMVQGMRKAAEYGPLASVGVDTWGVDFALLGRDGTLLGNPRHYRDPHTEGIMDEAFVRMPRRDIFQHTGIQFMRFNTLFQLLALQRDRSPLLDMAEALLFMADLFHFWFTGVKANEFTNASTSQMIDPRTRSWAHALLGAFDLTDRILGSIVPPGTVLGPMRAAVAAAANTAPIPVIAPATHDTGSAVAVVPARGDSWAYVSSGTWSLMGVELREPLVNDKTLEFNFTNEGGAAGTVRLLKNIMGLWLVQECRRSWERAGTNYSYDQLMHLAAAAPAFRSVIDPDDPSFILPGDMPQALANFCSRTNQPVPDGPGAVVRCALESLALRYRWVLERLEELTGRRLNAIHIVGGGSQNTLLCQLAADACNRPVLAGPVEATAIGNVVVQAIGLGLLGSVADGREVVGKSFELRSYNPQNPDRWHEPYARFVGFLRREPS